MATISLKELRPERHNLELENGELLEFKSIQELTPAGLAEFEALIAETQVIAADMKKPIPKGRKGKQSAREKMVSRNIELAADLEKANDAILQLLASKPLNGELSDMSVGVKTNFILWLAEQSKKKIKDESPQSES